MKKSLLALFAVVCIFTVVSCGKGSDVETLENISINSSDIGTSTDWFPIDRNTQIELTDIEDSDVFVVVKKSASNSRGVVRGIDKGNADKGGLIASETGNTIIRQDEEGNAKFAGSGVGASNGVYYAKVEKLPSQTLTDVKDLKLEVYDYEGKDKEKVYIENSNCGEYYISEKVLHVNLNDSNIEALSKCVIARDFQYYDGNHAEDPNYTGIHNTRDTYGFLMKEQGKYIIKNSGVCNLSNDNYVNLYAGFASNVIMGSGMKLRIVPVTVISSTNDTIINSKDAVFGIEQGEDSGEYALEINLDNGSFHDHSLTKTSTEIRKYDGRELETGVSFSYEMNDKTVYYYLGSIQGDFYVYNNVANDDVKYKVKLVNFSEVKKDLKVDHPQKLVFEVNTSGTEGITTSGNTVTYKEVESNISQFKKHDALLLKGIPKGTVKYVVNFEKYNGSTWEEFYNNSQLQCKIGHSSTGNKLLEYTASVGDDGLLPVQCEYWNVDCPLRATITFTYPE